MNPQLLFVLGVLGLCVAMFVANRPRMDVVALMALMALPLAGIVTVAEALAGFSDPNVVLIALLFVVGEGLVRTGIANRIGEFLIRRTGGSEKRLIPLLMVSVAVLGSVMSSTGVVAIFIPVVLDIAERRDLPPGRLMMPLAMAGLMSGMLTLIGTAPNLVVNSALQEAGVAGFSFFSFTPFGAAILAAGVVYMLMARRWLTPPGEDGGRRSQNRRRSLMDFVRDYQLAAREHRLRISGNSPLVGRTLQDFAADDRAARIVAIERITGSRHVLLEPRRDSDLRAGDVLLVDFADPVDEARARELEALKLERLPLHGQYFTDQSRELGMVEVLLPPDSELIGRTVIEANFGRRYGLNAIGLRRKRAALEGGVAGERLRAGDVLLLFGRWPDIRALQTQTRDFLVLSLPTEIDHAVPAASRAPYALASLIVMLLLMVTGWVPNVIAALLACLLMAIGGCLSLDSAYRSIQWPSLILIVGMMPFAVALERTGGVELAVTGLIRVFGDAEPRVMLAVLFALTATVGLFISNTATALLLAPIALTAADKLNVSPYPFAMTVALAASAAFMTPVSSPVNTLVVVPGRYHFGDFVRVGVPFTVVVLIITVLLVPWLLPLRP